MTLRCALATGSFLLLAAAATAQEQPSKSRGTYRLQFTVQQTEGSQSPEKKAYSVRVDESGWGKLRVGNKIPVQTTGGTGQQFSYVDVGLNLDCRMVGSGDQLTLHTSVEASSLAGGAGTPGRPVIRQMRAESEAAITLGKATPIATLDDPETKRHYEIEVTATRVP